MSQSLTSSEAASTVFSDASHPGVAASRLGHSIAAVRAGAHRGAERASTFLSNLTGVSLVVLAGFVAVLALQGHEQDDPRGQSVIEGGPALSEIKTRRVPTERIDKSGVSQTGPGNSGMPPVPVTSPLVPSDTVPTETKRDAAAPPAAKVESPAPVPSPLKPAEPVEKAIVAPPLPTEWTEAQRTAAAAVCMTALQAKSIRSEAALPMRSGACGDASPVTVMTLGEPAVTLKPAITSNCKLAGAVDVWVKEVLQPAAKELLGSLVVSMEGTSSYVCRNRNGAAAGPISEHAFANAFDVASFRLADGRVIDVAAWGATVVRPIALPQRSPPLKIPAKEKRIGAPGASQLGKSEAMPAPPVTASTSAAGSEDVKISFLKRIHRDACHLFGTVLGPEANEAHREHLHFDLKRRGSKSFCE